MNQLIIITWIICSLLIILGFLALLAEKLYGLLLIVLGIFVLGIPNKDKPLTIDLPEEYKLISKDKNKPDTLLGVISNDTLHITFKH